MPDGERRYGPDSIRVLAKAMSVLELLAEADGEMSLHDISTRLGINKSTCHRILSTLSAGEFVEWAGPGSYRLGVGTFRVGSAMGRRMEVRGRVLPAMQDVYRTTGETVFLCVPRGEEAVCVERLDGRFASTHTLRIGGTLPLHVGAAPRVLLAARPDAEIEEYLAHPHEPAPSSTELWRQVRGIRAADYAISCDDVEKGVKAIGVPVRDLTGEVVAAVSLSGLTKHIPESDEGRLIGLLRTVSERSSHALGHR